MISKPLECTYCAATSKRIVPANTCLYLSNYSKSPLLISEITGQKKEQNRYWQAFELVLTLLSKPIFI
jgi:hypothetical protein